MGRPKPKTHDEMRKSVCVNCLASGCKRQISCQMLEAVRASILPSYKLDDESLPQGICEQCRSKFRREGLFVCSLDYKELRENFKCVNDKENFCVCFICSAGRATKFKPKLKKVNAPSTQKTCKTCLSVIAPGHEHECKIGNRVENVLSWLPPDVTQQVSSTFIQRKAGNSSSVVLKRKKGPQMKVMLGKVPQKPRP